MWKHYLLSYIKIKTKQENDCDKVAVWKPLNHCIDCVPNNQPEDQPGCSVRLLVVWSMKYLKAKNALYYNITQILFYNFKIKVY